MQYDFIIIGTGAGGGTLAYSLAKTGKKILILERGQFIPREKENWDPVLVAQGRYRSTESWIDKDGNKFSPYTHYCVGGNTKMYGSALLRMRQRDFSEVKHHGGISPSWPLAYEAFERYYTQAEYMYSVHGNHTIDPTEPHHSKPLPFGQLTYEPRMQELSNDFKALGLNPSPIPVGVRLNEDLKYPHAATRLALFDGYPDPTEAKADAHVVGINGALMHANVEIETGVYIEKLLTDNSGKKIVGVVGIQNNSSVEYKANIVIVSCGAINSAALLLRSANSRHPDGLANGSGQVGRNLMIHNNGVVLALMEQKNPSEFQKAFYIPDYYFNGGDSPLPLGTIQLMGKADPDTMTGELKNINSKLSIEEAALHTVDFFITAEDLPDPNNRVLLGVNGEIEIHYTQNNLDAYNGLRSKLVKALDVISAKYTQQPNQYLGFKLGVGGVSHQNGTCRFGTDPQTSVLDLNCKAHEIENLYVLDGSFFPSSSAVNPSLTIMANALRVSEHLVSLS